MQNEVESRVYFLHSDGLYRLYLQKVNSSVSVERNIHCYIWKPFSNLKENVKNQSKHTVHLLSAVAKKKLCMVKVMIAK